jgi:3-deoxy-D-manno-octulosonate 8-phosphate phosphatase (KDO 8-P phosphatase)
MNHLELFSSIHTFIFDVDGVMTNNEVTVTENGELLRNMNVRDGLGMKLAIERGFRVAVITGGRSEGVKKRLEALGITDIYSGVSEKIEAFEHFIKAYDLDAVGILYMGDDLPDYPVMRRVGLAACPKNAAPELFPISNYISPYNGGEGCVRDVIEKVLRLQGKWGVEG